jgi:hypothetical protein
MRWADSDQTSVLVEDGRGGCDHIVLGLDSDLARQVAARIAAGETPDLYVGPSLAAVKAQLKAVVDAAAERERMKYLTAGEGQALVYEAKRTEVARWHSLGDPLNPVAELYPWAAGRAATFDVSIHDVLLEWAGQVDAWTAIGIAIEAVRESAKAAVDAAEDEAAARAAVDGLAWPSPN